MPKLVVMNDDAEVLGEIHLVPVRIKCTNRGLMQDVTVDSTVDPEFVKLLVEAGEAAFWQAVAEAAGDRITSGDFPPEMTMKVMQQMTEAVSLWVKLNQQ